MKQAIFLLLPLLIMPWLDQPASENNPNQGQVLAVVQTFLENLEKMNVDAIPKSFHPDAVLFFCNPKGVRKMLIQGWCQELQEIKKNPEHLFNKEKSHSTVQVMSISGNVAVVKVERLFSQLVIVDFLSLGQINNEWLIVTKVLTMQPVTPSQQQP